MAKTFREYSPDHLLLMTPSLREWLPKDHAVYFVSDLVETLDLSAIYGSYDEERGYPPYHPLLMTKLLVYGRKELMARKLRTKRGREEYGKRKTTVEPVFGQIKGPLDFRQFLLRGHEKVRGEWMLVCTASNILKLFRAGRRVPAVRAA